jgi:hypothetical protein
MAGEGMYNRHSAPQHVANELGLGLLTEAAEQAPLDGTRATGVADYGASQGRNSLEPMRAVIWALRRRLDALTPISIVHTDLADNDFAALFTTLRDDPQSYLRIDDAVFPSAVGRSFYELILPPNTVSIAWAAVTVHWSSHAPLAPREHIFTPLASDQERAAFAQVAADDWQAFLAHRSTELVSGGRLVVIGSGADADRLSGAEGLLDMANSVLQEMVADGSLAADDYRGMVVPTYYRTREEFLAPLAREPTPGRFQLESSKQTALADPLWAEFERTNDLDTYSKRASDFLRAFTEPALFGALGARESPQVAKATADDFYARLATAVAREPEQAVCSWYMILLSLVNGH